MKTYAVVVPGCTQVICEVYCHIKNESLNTHGLPLPLCICQTGVVQVNRPLDRERVAEYTLTITVKDNPENPRIARRVIAISCAHYQFHHGHHKP